MTKFTNITTRQGLFTLQLFFILVISNSVYSNEVDIKKNKKDDTCGILFRSDEILELTLITNFKILQKDTKESKQYLEGYMVCKNLSGSTDTMDVAIRTRGRFRLNPVNCNFPPLLIKFGDKETANTEFQWQSKLKLVTHCQNKQKHFEQYMYMEYLAYKIYNILTDTSFKVRLARINYIDLADTTKSLHKVGFFVENDKALACRLGIKEYDVPNIPQDHTDLNQITLITLFQYLIGNTDWSVSGLHNIKLFLSDVHKPPIPVPFDFDWSGIVNASYASPAQQLGIPTVRTRLYRGYYRSEAQLAPLIKLFNDKKDEIYKLFTDFELLDNGIRKSTISYLDDFYKIINNPSTVNFIFIENCRKN